MKMIPRLTKLNDVEEMVQTEEDIVESRFLTKASCPGCGIEHKVFCDGDYVWVTCHCCGKGFRV